MKCKVFKIVLQNDGGEAKLNEFLETVDTEQVFASVINAETPFWSVLVFYKNAAASPIEKNQNLKSAESSYRTEAVAAPKPVKSALPKKEVVAANSPSHSRIKLTAAQEKSFNALRSWRNAQATQERVPAHIVAHNDSLMQMALMDIKTLEDLLQVKGLGEKRAEKYGDKILEILKSNG